MTELEHLHIQRRALGVCIIIAALGSPIACTRGPKGLNGPGYLAAQKAIDAINRAYEYREKGAMYYEPRLLDAQRSVSEIPATDDARPEGQFKTEAKTCVSILQIYRLKLETDALESQNRRTKAEAAMADYELKQSYYEAAKCVRDLPAVLSRLADAGK
jgi:hypothetical protein